MNQYKIKTHRDFEKLAIKMFNNQYENNLVYNKYCNLLGISPPKIKKLIKIPFLPIQFFKTHKVISNKKKHKLIFESSGTSGKKSRHFVTSTALYEKSFRASFKKFYGNPRNYVILALLPSFQEKKNSSLVYMVNDFIKSSNYDESKFYMHHYESLYNVLNNLKNNGTKTILFGITHALIDFLERFKIEMKNLIIIETGGMKGLKKEIPRDQLHLILKKGFGSENVHSEYGMTELFSQSYSIKNGIFKNPSWMKVFIRDLTNPLSVKRYGKGAINIIDLANENSCSFLATDDIGKVNPNGSFEILGRLRESELRGCNLMFHGN